MKYLVSILSEHLLPNYLLCKEFLGDYDKHIFISTPSMLDNNIVTRMCGVLDIEKDSVKVVNVSEDDLPDIQNKLRNENFKKSDRYLINLTGGTKMMSIGVFQHFFKFDAEFFYIPIFTNKIENVRSGNSLSLKYRVNVTEYLSLYGFSISVSNLIDSHNLSKGEAFEKFVFDSIRKVKNLCPEKDQIAQGVKIFRNQHEKQNDNEIDVMWTENNQLYVGECKVSLWKPKELDIYNRPINDPPGYLDEIMYKISAISKDFGLRVNPYIFIKKGLNPYVFNEQRLKAVEKRMKILGIKGVLNERDLLNIKIVQNL